MRCVYTWLTQSVTNLFVEFLLSEVERAKASTGATNEASSAEAQSSGEASADQTTFDLHSLSDLDRSLHHKSKSTSHSGA